MDFPRTYQLSEIAQLLNCEFDGPEHLPVIGINEIHVVRPGDLVFVDHPKYYSKALNSAATTILINQKVSAPEGKGLLISDDPFRDFNKLTALFKPFAASHAQIAESAEIGADTVIQPGAYIGNHVKIGKNCLIHANVSIYDHTEIGDEVVIHANTVLGADAFYYKKRESGFDPLKSGGKVVIEDKVHIGASCTIDRGVSHETRIGYDTKIDNSVHIGHDTQIGKHCLFASQVGIAGCVIIEDHVTLWGQVGVSSSIRIGEKAVVLAQSGISKSLEANKTYFGYPAEEARKKYREMASIRVLPQIIENLNR
jgi:UDP-3-O-[3-hydroxymyristoyl] glucosamine N-acyltransferase